VAKDAAALRRIKAKVEDQVAPEGVAQVVLVPTSAQTRICRPVRYADLGEKVLADWGDRRVEVGIPPAALAIVVLLVVGEGGDGGQTSESGEQGVDGGAAGPVRR
jgi:hypothetical protein